MLPDNSDETLYQIALTFVKDIGPKRAKALLAHYGNASDIFKASVKQMARIDGFSEDRARAFKEQDVLTQAEQEFKFVQKHGVQVLWVNNDNYPQRLKHCSDAPIVLYYRGTASPNAAKTVAVIGTRKNTDYGQKLTEQLIDDLSGREDLIIVSGLAHGIDAIAHKRSLKAGLPTIGALGHGLDRIYPSTNKEVAKDMLLNGGLITEFPTGTKPERQNFPMRNRIVAGISDVTVVVESDIKGGALITARVAASYNRDVAAFPGRTTDSKSSGCNELIRTNTAAMITKADDLIEMMGWATVKKKPVQKQLFLDLSPDEQKILELLQRHESIHADELLHTTGIANAMLPALLLGLEMQGLIRALPGKQYRYDA
ncbi:MAG: DNA-protecting protein DprA [Sphingobacteriales bacterium]|nr:MAG: DNA-protecting protein DprA [Sphingobacteriales bacterium]